ncbi:hypothetical protein HN587_06635 [Candidatus Woesearchaeota archaeon]|jgi:hypothetical protein|nr:hypothetical protein [Candidatus Woesearchaeota archaeon]
MQNQTIQGINLREENLEGAGISCNEISDLIHELVSELETHDLSVELVTPKELPGDQQDLLIDLLYDVALDSFGRWLPYEAIDGRTREADYVLLLKRDERVIGYAVNEVMELAGKTVNYYNTILLRREIQHQGIAEPLFKLELALGPSDYLLSRTQNPALYRAMDRLCSQTGYKMHPNGVEVPEALKKIVLAYDPEVGADLVKRGVYFGRALMYDTPKPKTEEAHIWEKLGVEKGDAIMLVAERVQN